MKKIILHLCADIGSDSYPYQLDDNYEVIKIGKDIGVENYTPPKKVHAVICNPVCTQFSIAVGFDKVNKDPDLSMVKHCERIIRECNPTWWVIENPATGTMKNYLGKPTLIYQPWEYGSPWTKKTALWGNFNIPAKLFSNWENVEKNEDLYIRPGRKKPGFVYFHKSAIHLIEEFKPFMNYVKTDNCFRSLCSQGFANAFKEVNP
jgi:hypothetical protein